MITEIKKILVPVDFSENSKKIMKSAAAIGEKFSATLAYIFVVQSFEVYSGFFVPHMPISQFEDEMVSSAEKKMEVFLRENLQGDAAYLATVATGDIAEEIISYAENENFDLIIMGTHGYKGVERILFGSVAEQVVKTSPCPVLTINPYK